MDIKARSPEQQRGYYDGSQVVASVTLDYIESRKKQVDAPKDILDGVIRMLTAISEISPVMKEGIKG